MFPPESRIEFPALKAGDYEVGLIVPGSATWRAPRVRIGPGNTVLHADLKPGTDVQMGYGLYPGNESSELLVFDLSRDGRFLARYDSLESPNETIRGLALGRYTISVLSSAEAAAYRKSRHPEYEPEEDGPEWRRTKVEFVLSNKTPATLEFPPIQLTSIKPDNRK